MHIILASKSPRRRQILRSMGLIVIVMEPSVTEFRHGAYPLFTPIRNAIIKAEAVAKQCPEQYVIAADTVILFRDRILEKPSSMAQARDFFRMLSGESHEVVTSVCLTRLADHIECTYTDTSTVCFHSLDNQMIDAYFDKVNPLDKAGAYGIQEHGEMIIKAYVGEVENIMGLPRRKTSEALEACGFFR